MIKKNKIKELIIRNKIAYISLFMAMLAAALSFATPNSINIQGKLINPSGSVLTGTYNFTFRVYDSYTAGNLLYESNVTSTTDSRGVYDIILNSINLTFTDQLYLAVKVNDDSEMEPRINLTSVPYTFRANVSEDLNKNNAYTVSGLNSTGNISLGSKITFGLGQVIDNLLNGWLTITGALNVGNNLIVGGNASFSGNLSVAGNLSVNGNKLFVDSTGGKVGIGTISPAHALHVIGNINATGSINATRIEANEILVNGAEVNKSIDLSSYNKSISLINYNQSVSLVLYNQSIDLSSYNKSVDLSGYLKSTTNDSLWNSTGNDIYLRRQEGNVGIGTSSPSVKLVVIGNVNISDALNVSGRVQAASFAGDGSLLTGTASSLTVGDVSCTNCLTNTEVASADTATTATSLAANGGNCGAGQWAAGVDADGAAEGCTADDDTPDSDSEVPDSLTVSGGSVTWSVLASYPTACTSGNFVQGVDDTLTCAADDDTPDSDSEVPDSITISNGVLYAPTSGNVGIGTAVPSSESSLNKFLEIESTTALHKVGIILQAGTDSDWEIYTDDNNNDLFMYDGSDIQVRIRNDESAQNDDGWATATVDYGEYMRKLDPSEDIKPFEIVGIKNGKVTKNTKDAAFYMISSSNAGLRGGNPIDMPRGNNTNWIVVAYTGQVPALIKGKFNEGDYVIPSGLNDGIAVAVSPEKIKPEQYSKVVGKILNEFVYDFLEESDGGFEVELRKLMARKGNMTIVNVAVGIGSGITVQDQTLSNRIQISEDENRLLKNQINSLKIQVDDLKSRLINLEEKISNKEHK